MNRGWPSPIPSLGQLSKRPRHPKACRHLPAVLKAQQVKEAQVVWELGRAGSQLGASDVQRVMQIQIRLTLGNV